MPFACVTWKMVVLVAVFAFHQLLQWFAIEKGEKENKQADGSILPSEMMMWLESLMDLCGRYKEALDRILELEKNAEERQKLKLGNMLEEERVRHETLLDMEKDKMQELVECKVCMEEEVSRTFNCGHAACAGCAGQLQYCHICRTRVHRINLLYL